MHATLIHGITDQQLEIMISRAVGIAMEKYHANFPQQTPIHVADKLLSKKDAAKYLSISLPTLSKYINSGHVKAHTVAGTRMRFRLSDLDKALRTLRK